MIRDLWSKLNLPQAFALATVVAGVACSLIFAPPELWARIDWKWLVGVVVAGLGAGGSAFLGKLFHSEPVRGSKSNPPPPAP